ncbi:hypothetical protein PILCRDRAFT_78496, partial [Piloderma croceum F 1598]
LDHVHSRGIVHCDIKPENFLFGAADGQRAGYIHLVDFGLARYSRHAISKVDRLQEQTPKLAGTLRYASLNAHRGISMCSRRISYSVTY